MHQIRRVALVGVGLVALALGACATTKNGKTASERLSEQAAEGALERSLEVLSRPENHERIAGLLASPPIHEAIRAVSASVVAGAFDGMIMGGGTAAAPVTTSRSGAVVGGTEQQLEAEVTEQEQRFATELGPGFDDEWPEARSRPARLVSTVGDAVASGVARAIEDDIGPALAIAIERQLGPALARALEHDVLPAVGRGVQSEDVQQAIKSSTASIGVGAARGAQQGLEEVGSEGSEEAEGTLRDLGRALTIGAIVATVAAGLFAVVLVVLMVMLVRTSRSQRQVLDESRRREQLLIELIQQRAESSVEHPIISPGTA